ncbi:hypothetical protein EXT46_05745 [Pseudoalteromonas sp. CO325X]|uniref:hypothetical protein n=1 Tax=Pseudoalteromonas sp. CO325X TaxID=1777262 RepID=UPI001023AF61|nr:hypothetical protein [Pseudoalteromonas sp. CO325X]RZF82954.1 hypothetical protein EXT46_05745 [Pseudoalteromonas sp. CO325X]
MTERPNLPETIDNGLAQKDGYGVIIGSLSRANAAAIYDIWSISLRSKDSNMEQDVNILGKASTTAPFVAYDFDYKEKKYSGNLFAYIVPAGEYEFYNYRLFQNRGALSRNWHPEDEFSIPIEVKSGAINYIGEYSATKDYFWEITSNKARDIPLFKARYPNLDWSELIISLPKKSNESSVLIKK